jgi:multiple sugar transport system permease protein
MLKPVMLVCIVIRAIDAFRTFDQVWVITAGGPARGTELFSVYAYIEAFQNLNFGRGSAAAVTGGIIIMVFGLLMYKMLARLLDVSR